MIDSMNVYEEMRKDIKELIELVRVDVLFYSLVAYGESLPMDQNSRFSHQLRNFRINELSQKYDLF